jgi:hypothetical protein
MSFMLPAVALTGWLALVAGQSSQQAAETGAPSEPYRMVYTMASSAEVMLLDLNSVTKIGDVAEAWSLTFLAEPLLFENAPSDAQVFWTKIQLDCASGTGQFVEAIGLENSRVIFTVPITPEPTPLATAWPVEEELICKDVQGARTAATTFAEAAAAARTVMSPPATTPSPSNATNSPAAPGHR